MPDDMSKSAYDIPKSDASDKQKLSDDAINTLHKLRKQLREIEETYNNKHNADNDVHSDNSFTSDINTSAIEFPHR
jgi:hypothetical protein